MKQWLSRIQRQKCRYAMQNSMLCMTPERDRSIINSVCRSCLLLLLTYYLVARYISFLTSPWKQIPSCKRQDKVRFSVSREHTFIKIVALKSNFMLTCCVFFLERPCVLKALTTFTFIQRKRKHLWDVKIAFRGKTENEQEHKNQQLTKIHSK